jgi:hypothetical protein
LEGVHREHEAESNGAVFSPESFVTFHIEDFVPFAMFCFPRNSFNIVLALLQEAPLTVHSCRAHEASPETEEMVLRQYRCDLRI